MPATLHHQPGLLNPAPTPDANPAPDRSELAVDRGAPDAVRRVAQRTSELARSWPLPADAPTLDTWRALAELGRIDLSVARLVEGHVDALWILAEADRRPHPGAVYGVWASASGGTGLTGIPVSSAAGNTDGGGWQVNGTMRYCSGAWFVDRALVVVSTPEGNRLMDVDVRAGRDGDAPSQGSDAPSQGSDALSHGGAALSLQEDTWPAVGMDTTRSVDVVVRDLRVPAADTVGRPGFYVDRPGFAAGGVGVAAVWLGGAAGVLDALLRALAGRPATAHQKAHLGAIAARIAAADALLGDLAARMDELVPSTRALDGGWNDALAARTVVELAVDDVLQRAPRVSGVTPLCRDAGFAHRLADLAVYVRQHHGETDHEQLGAQLLESGTLLGRTFG